jgi:hypothetical protein
MLDYINFVYMQHMQDLCQAKQTLQNRSHFLTAFYCLRAQVQTTLRPTLSRSVCLRVGPLLVVMARFLSPFRHCGVCCGTSLTTARIYPSSNLCLSHCYRMHLQIYNFMHIHKYQSKTHTHTHI